MEAYGYYFTGAGAPLEKRTFAVGEVQGDDVIVKILEYTLRVTEEKLEIKKPENPFEKFGEEEKNG